MVILDKRMCWLALCWLMGGCLDKASIDKKITVSTSSSSSTSLSSSASTNNIVGSASTAVNTTTTKKFVDSYLHPNKPQAYTTRWDKINLDELFTSKRLMQHYFNCLLNKGPCPPDGRELKRALPEALANGCAKCTKSQIDGAIKVIRYLREYEPVKFKMLAEKYDRRGIYRKRYFERTEETNNSIINDQTIDDNHRRRRKRHVKRPSVISAL